MREILFRGKRIFDNGQWVEGCLLKVTLDGETWHLIFGDDFQRSGLGITAMQHAAVNPETVGQYTGLKDKNGKRIFEGDVVSYKWVHQFTEDDDIEDYGNQFPDKISDCLGVVEFRNGKFMPLPERHDCDDYWYSDGQYGFEVIGNIHDNPELLEAR